MIVSRIWFTVLIVFSLFSPVTDGAVRVWQDSLVLKTWSEGAPEVNPPFEALVPGWVYPSYPYARRTSFLTDTSSQTWRTLDLENEYLLYY